jgi:hypothetical protein
MSERNVVDEETGGVLGGMLEIAPHALTERRMSVSGTGARFERGDARRGRGKVRRLDDGDGHTGRVP